MINAEVGKKNLKDSIREVFHNKTIVFCIIYTLLYFISGFYKWLEILPIVVAVISFCVLSIKESTCVFAYCHCFTLSNLGYGLCFNIILVAFTVILFIRYCIGLKLKKYPFYKSLFISLVCFIVFYILISFFYNLYGEEFYLVAIFFLAYLILSMHREFDIHKIMSYMTVGLFVSCLIASVCIIIPAYKYNLFLDDTTRFNAFTNHTNYLYMRAVFIVIYYMYRFLTKNLKFLHFGLIYILCSAIILSTQSKTGLGMLALFTFIFFILYLKDDFKHRIKIVLILLLILGVLALIGYKFIIAIFDRFTLEGSSSIINSILTGRDDIWLDYINAIFSNPYSLIFGHGLVSEEVFINAQQMTRASHNLYLFLLYRFGIIGCIALAFIIYMFIKIINKGRPLFIASLPLIWFLIESLCDNTFKPYNFTYLIFAIMIMYSENKKIKLNKTNSNSEIQDESKVEVGNKDLENLDNSNTL